jgi:hypothetical protein
LRVQLEDRSFTPTFYENYIFKYLFFLFLLYLLN